MIDPIEFSELFAGIGNFGLPHRQNARFRPDALGPSTIPLKTVRGEDDISQIGEPKTVFAVDMKAAVKKYDDGEFTTPLPGFGRKILHAGLRVIMVNVISAELVSGDM